MEYKKTDFVDVKYIIGEGAPIVSQIEEYFFDALTNTSRHDLKLKTSEGNQFLMTNKEIICLASSFFRQNLKESTTEFTVGRADSVESIDICLTYLVTGKYKRPSTMTPKLASEIYSLATQWKVFEPKVLKNSLERHCYEELCKNHEDLIYVCTLLIASDDSQFTNVQNCCTATINYYHFNDFMRTFSHPLKERFTQRRDFLRPSLAMQVKKAFASSREARNFIKYLPALGED
uniref:BTB domain-containing protein n=1 Tax=Caenorhabditis tropicalis TaxID=1561998 RepID=A0A1I7TKP8_9PELO